MSLYYSDESIRLHNGDCLEVLPTLDPDDFAVLLTDPPYGIDYNSGSRRDTLARSIEGDKDTSLRDAVLDWWGDRPALVFGTWRIPRPAKTHTRLIWDTKGALGMGDLRVPWKPSDQEIYVLGQGFSGVRDTNVLACAPVQSMARNGRLHPHQKPVDLLVRLLDKCPPGAVLDPFAGSLSTLVAARQMGRPATGIEYEESYCRDNTRRLAQDSMFGGAA